MSVTRFAVTLALLLPFAPGCARIDIVHREPARKGAGEEALRSATGPLRTATVRTWLWGFKPQEGAIPLSEGCPQGWTRATTQTSFWQGVVKAVTLNVKSDWAVEVECRGNAGH